MDAAPYDIICGPDFSGQNVKCCDGDYDVSHPPPHNVFKVYITGFINTSVNNLLFGIAPYLLQTQEGAARVCTLKQEIFKLCLNIVYYARFEAYMHQEMPNLKVVGGSLPIFDLSYILAISPFILPPSNTTLDGYIINYKILHLYIIGLTIYLASSAGWLDVKQVIEYVETGRSTYSLYLPNDAFVPQTLIQGFRQRQISFGAYKQITSIQNLYILVAYNFFTLGGASFGPTSFGRNVGLTKTYKADIVSVVVPAPFPRNRIIWNNPDQSLSTEIHLSCYDEEGEFLLKDGVTGGNIIIRHPVNTAVVFQNWRIESVSGVVDDHVTYRVRAIRVERRAKNDEVCEIVILKPGQIIPEPSDDIRRQVLKATHSLGGRKKRQTKSRRIKQKNQKNQKNQNKQNKQKKTNKNK